LNSRTTIEEINIQEVKELLDKAYAARVNAPDNSIALAKRALAVAHDIRNEEMVARANSDLGLFHMIIGKFEDAKRYSLTALEYFEPIGNLKGIADAKYTIAGVHYKTDDYHIGLEYLLDCLNIYRQLNDSYNEARVLKSMGTIYEYFGDQENAIRAYLRSIEAGRVANDPNLESNAYNPLSGIYLKRGMHELALTTIEKSIAIKEETNDLRGLAFALYGRGKVYIKTKNYSQAKKDLEKSLSIQKEMGDKLGLTMALNKLGVLYYSIQNFDEAKKFLLESLETAEKFNIRFIIYKCLYNLHLVARSEDNPNQALHYLERYIKIKESIINTHTHNVIKSYEAISKVKALEHEAEVQRSKTEIIEKKNAELDSFFYRVSHDLKGPISSLIGLHNLVKIDVQDQEAQRYFQMYQSQIMRINTIVMDLINLTRMNNPAMNLTRIDFELLLEECISAYQYLPQCTSIRFIKQIDKKIEFYSEWAIVNTILQNLVENAIKYSHPERDSFVRVSIRQNYDRITIEVQDNGIGIPPDYQAKIFDMFFRANDRVDGTGLGLYILKRAVERLHGHVSFVSEPLIGSTFTVILPVASGKHPQTL
jgi:signal transduction histidine kinase